MTWHYQNNTGVFTDSHTRNTQGVESGNNVSRTEIQVHRGMPLLQDKHWNNVQWMRTTNGNWKVQ